ncbi:unnamed protein product [Urochloa humidicola]
MHEPAGGTTVFALEAGAVLLITHTVEPHQTFIGVGIHQGRFHLGKDFLVSNTLNHYLFLGLSRMALGGLKSQELNECP